MSTQSDKLELSTDPFDNYLLYINGRDLIAVDGSIYLYEPQRLTWRQVTADAIKADVFKWFRKNGGAELIRENGKSVKTHIDNLCSFILKHTDEEAFENPFKDSAITPYLPTADVLILFRADAGEPYRIIGRDEKEYSFFRNLFLTKRLDFSLGDPTGIVREAPTFARYVRDLIPPEALEGLNRRERRREIVFTFRAVAQILAYVLSPIKLYPYLFLIVGGEGTGKSTLLDIIKVFIGEQYVVQRRMSDLINNRFATSDLPGASVLNDDDISADSIPPDDFLKQISGSKSLTIERKHENAQHGVKISIAVFLLGNYEISLKGQDGIRRRAVVLSVDRKPRNPDPLLVQRIAGEVARRSGEPAFDERPAILRFALDGWERMARNDFQIEVPWWMERAKERWLQRVNSVASFVTENTDPDAYRIRLPRKKVYEAYSKYCKESGLGTMGKIRFYGELRTNPEIVESAVNGADYFEIKVKKGGYLDDGIPF